MKSRFSPLAFFALALLALAGCVTEFKNQPDMLKAAGFRPFIAGSPTQVAMLKALPPDKISPVINHGRIYYIFPDTENGRAYAGTKNEFRSYEKLRARQKQIQDNVDESSIAKAPDWTSWVGLSDGWYSF